MVGHTLGRLLNMLQGGIEQAKDNTDQQRKEAHGTMVNDVKDGFTPLFKMTGSQHATAPSLPLTMYHQPSCHTADNAAMLYAFLILLFSVTLRLHCP